jgi:fibrillin 2/3
MRKELCYLSFSGGQCKEPMSQTQTRMLCCCSMGQAWGNPCNECPRLGSRDHMLLCGTLPGQYINPMTNQTEHINECALMPQMCQHGQCINTPGSFECQCDRGYVYDEAAHQCIGTAKNYFTSDNWKKVMILFSFTQFPLKLLVCFFNLNIFWCVFLSKKLN